MKIKAYHSFKLVKSIHYLAWLSIPFVLIFPSTFSLPAFLIGLVLLTSLGSSGALHRYFCHQSFKTGKIRHWILALLGTLSTQGSIAQWVQYHRSHHRNSDTEDDPISPTFVGFWKAFHAIQNLNSYKDVKTRDIVIMLRDPAVKFFHDWYWPTIILYVVILGLINPILILNMYFLPIFMIRFVFGLQNTFGHGVPVFDGYKNHVTKDNSYNSVFVNMITFCLGETLHNNHHHNPGKYNYKERWWELDLTGFLIEKVFIK